jgi:predicted ATP-dependent protease
VDQSLALTGSINQHGEVQAIGGVNEKIEGFFKLCKMRGLTGKQGVIVPESNKVNLVLDDEVIAAVEKGLLHVYAVATVDEALSLLMDRPAGELSDEGYPENSINAVAMAKLERIAKVVNGDDDKGEESHDDN